MKRDGETKSREKVKGIGSIKYGPRLTQFDGHRGQTNSSRPSPI